MFRMVGRGFVSIALALLLISTKFVVETSSSTTEATSTTIQATPDSSSTVEISTTEITHSVTVDGSVTTSDLTSEISSTNLMSQTSSSGPTSSTTSDTISPTPASDSTSQEPTSISTSGTISPTPTSDSTSQASTSISTSDTISPTPTSDSTSQESTSISTSDTTSSTPSFDSTSQVSTSNQTSDTISPIATSDTTSQESTSSETSDTMSPTPTSDSTSQPPMSSSTSDTVSPTSTSNSTSQTSTPNLGNISTTTFTAGVESSVSTLSSAVSEETSTANSSDNVSYSTSSSEATASQSFSSSTYTTESTAVNNSNSTMTIEPSPTDITIMQSSAYTSDFVTTNTPEQTTTAGEQYPDVHVTITEYKLTFTLNVSTCDEGEVKSLFDDVPNVKRVTVTFTGGCSSKRKKRSTSSKEANVTFVTDVETLDNTTLYEEMRNYTIDKLENCNCSIVVNFSSTDFISRFDELKDKKDLCTTDECRVEIAKNTGYQCDQNQKNDSCSLRHVCMIQSITCPAEYGQCYARVDSDSYVAKCSCRSNTIFERSGDDCSTRTMRWWIVLAITGGSGAAIIIILVFVIIALCAKRRRKADSFSDESERMFRTGYKKPNQYSGLRSEGFDNNGYHDDQAIYHRPEDNREKLRMSEYESAQNWNPDDSAGTYAYIESKLKETNYAVQIKRPQIGVARGNSDQMTNF